MPRQDGRVPNLLYQPGVILLGCLRMRNCIVRVIRGDLTKHSAEVIVKSLSGEFSPKQEYEVFLREISAYLYIYHVLSQDKCSNCRAVLGKTSLLNDMVWQSSFPCTTLISPFIPLIFILGMVNSAIAHKISGSKIWNIKLLKGRWNKSWLTLYLCHHHLMKFPDPE